MVGADRQTYGSAPRLLYDRKEAARQLSISLRSLAYLLSRGEIHFRRIGSKTLIPHSELVRFAKGHHPKPLASK
jgi:excisionase family DNA binding protein